MTLNRITSTVGAMVLGGVLVASTYGAQAAGTPSMPDGSQHGRMTERPGHFQSPVAHRYGSNGMRMGLHCETSDAS